MYNIDTNGNKYFTRNPYYFAVDAAGNQLPYIDEQMCVIVADAQTRTLKLINGELEAAGENPLPVKDYTLYKENENNGNYNVYLFDNSRGSDAAFTFTQTLEDETLRGLFTNVSSREAMSLAIDRDAINETLYFGLATVRQAMPPANTSFYEDWMGDYMVQYDPDGAAQRLDDLGCVWDASHTARQMPNGQPFNIIVESTEEFAPVGEMVAEILLCMGASAVLVGDVGSGSITKLANQIIVALNIAAMGEAMALAARSGVDPARVFDAIRGGLAGSTVLSAKMPMMLNRNFQPGFRIALHIKDLKNALEAGNDAGMLLELGSQGGGALDHSALVQHFEKLGNVVIQSPKE